MKKIKFLPAAGAALAITLVLSGSVAAPQASALPGGDYAVFFNGKPVKLDAVPKLSGDTMLVPLRNIAESVGAQVDWDSASQTATILKDNQRISLTIGSTTAIRSGSSYTLDARPELSGSVTLVPVRFLSEALGFAVSWDGIGKNIRIDDSGSILPVVGSLENLQALAAAAVAANSGGNANYSGIATKGMMNERAMTTDSKSEAPAASGSASLQKTVSVVDQSGSGVPEYSSTNVQVQGVDEADVVKTDGNYIYQVNNGRIIIAKTALASDIQLAGSIAFDKELQPLEMYVDGKELVVLAAAYHAYENKDSTAKGKMVLRPGRPGRPGLSSVKAIAYDISSKDNIKKIREVEVEGNYVSSRKIGSSVYVMTNKYMNAYGIQNSSEASPVPQFRDSAVSDQLKPVGYDSIRYFPDTMPDNFLTVAGFNLDKPDAPASVSSYLGSGQNVYASASNLYVAMGHSNMHIMPLLARTAVNGTASSASSMAVAPNSREETTDLFKFNLDEGQIRLAAKGSVPGTVLNQYSMDEQGGYFRIATTKGNLFGTGNDQSKNNVYVLNESLQTTGQLENLAPGEKIYSVRFMGSRAYMVTFKKVDPLFVIDLKDPKAPQVLGSLKIPGYSDYLHPYDDTHLIGFGKDAVEVANESFGGSAGSTTAFYQGMKIAMFDVSDVSHPKEMFKEAIGDRGTDSELLHNPKALLFSKEKGIMAFPVTLMKVNNQKATNNGIPAYGQFAYQGAYIYNVDLTKGFTQKGTITHQTDSDFKKSGNDWGNPEHYINRILYIGSDYYTLSNGEIRANDITTLKQSGSLTIPAK